MANDENFPEADDKKPTPIEKIVVQVLRDYWVANPKYKGPIRSPQTGQMVEPIGEDGLPVLPTIRMHAGIRYETDLTMEILDQIASGNVRRVKENEINDLPLGTIDPVTGETIPLTEDQKLKLSAGNLPKSPGKGPASQKGVKAVA